VSRDLGLLTSSLTDDRPETRAVLAGTQVVGLAFVRYVVRVEPLASMDAAAMVDVLAPTFQRILVGPLTG
jgi:Tetracyclin repressor-like, C-terminal domain